jgi:hypothetical protein
MRYLKFILPLLLVAVIDLLFQLGAWEFIASPNSHAGMSIAKKRALLDPEMTHIDFVMLGSSRPVYGIDHALLASTAATHGKVYANISVAGMHWMSLGIITDWLAEHHPEIQGGMIALSVQDFMGPGNGAYELGIAYPFHRFEQIPWMSEHVAFDRNELATYGLYSGLFEYREDIRDLIQHPQQRMKSLKYFHALDAKYVLQTNADETSNICRLQLQHRSDCEKAATLDAEAAEKLKGQCAILPGANQPRGDWHAIVNGTEAPSSYLQKTHDLIQAQLRHLTWKTPPIIVLMPMHSVWMNDALPQAAHEWTLSILQQLQDEGKIHVLDYTDLFNGPDGTDCTAFFDIYHNNIAGRDRLMQVLLPSLEKIFKSAEKPTVATIRHD